MISINYQTFLMNMLAAIGACFFRFELSTFLGLVIMVFGTIRDKPSSMGNIVV